ncbi:MAG: hypothetical protein IPI24_13260 [Ignavibacteria bacterium]|nr:hypothetical protein [Ignavibacteria bacterium]MBK7412724.1 hypothetical protein [Ignavibacteria bacterium]MBK7578375.1 hypothetical protein [Ignavibacteria bacterium]MBK9183076.1 hypothetical protein [Ignavibacteria bacterium]MBL0322960.1 hypothetical protein [Ignavibacteria bacterium]
MRVFATFVMAAACAVVVIGCSDAVAPTVAEDPGSMTDGQVAAGGDYLIKLGGVDGETEGLEEAMEIYSGNGTETAALLLPAIQKVREAMAELEEGATRDGSIKAGDAEKVFRKLINTHKPKGDAYSVQEICGASATEGGNDTDHKCWIIIESKHKNASANVEYQLHHFFNGVRLIMDGARVNDDEIDRAVDAVLAEVAVLSDERP